MRNILAVIGLVVVLFVGLGYYFEWYTFVLRPGTDGKQHIEVDVDTKKITDDGKKIIDQGKKALEQNTTKPENPTDFVGPPLPPELQPKPHPGQLIMPGPTKN